MRRVPVLLALALAAAAVAGAPSATGGTSSAKPALRLLDTPVPTFRGTGFKPRERVRLVILDPARHVVVVTAGAAGAFTKQVAAANPESCTGFSAIATGDRGSRTTLKRPPGVCPPPA